MKEIFNKNIMLQTEKILMRPISYQDIDGFRQIAFDEKIWKYNVFRISNDYELQSFLDRAIKDRESRIRYAFTIIDKCSGRIAGSSSYGNISEKDRRLEIGWTWLGTDFQGTGINKVCKYLLLNYAFNELNYNRVEFKTDFMNQKSNRALQKIGAVEEGVLRSHTLMHDGRWRDTVYYSILKPEWNELRFKIFNEFQNNV